eukprot:6212042-Pleurochrysis_carterae.AAC.2
MLATRSMYSLASEPGLLGSISYSVVFDEPVLSACQASYARYAPVWFSSLVSRRAFSDPSYALYSSTMTRSQSVFDFGACCVLRPSCSGLKSRLLAALLYIVFRLSDTGLPNGYMGAAVVDLLCTLS